MNLSRATSESYSNINGSFDFDYISLELYPARHFTYEFSDDFPDKSQPTPSINPMFVYLIYYSPNCDISDS